MTRTTLGLALLLVVGSYDSARATAADDTSRAWTILDQGAANADKVTRLKAVEALGLLVKDERARVLAESKITDPESTVRAAASTALGQIGLTTRHRPTENRCSATMTVR